MRDAILKWTLLVGALFVVGPLCGWLMAGVVAVDGSHQATALTGHEPVMGVARTIGAIALAAAIGIVASRRCGFGMGLFSAGLATAWAAGSSGTVVGVLNATRDHAVFIRLAIEGVGVLIVGGAIIWAMSRAARASGDDPEQQSAKSVESIYAGAAAMLAGGFAAWFIAREGSKGQAIAAAAGAGAVGATVARVIAPEAARWVVASAALLLGVAGPIAALVVHKDQALDAAFLNRLLALGKLAPLDWLAGVLMGAPLGLSWAASILHNRLEGEKSGASGAAATS